MKKLKDSRSRSKDGFTLIEVLIVVVIIGVLAALVIPRMLGQTEKANIAEAYNRIGALCRAKQAYMDFTGESPPSTFVCSNPPGTCNQTAELSKLGLADFPQKIFRYSCQSWAGAYFCGANRWGVAGTPTIVQYYTGSNSGRWQCFNGYVTADGGVAGFSDKGCRPDW